MTHPTSDRRQFLRCATVWGAAGTLVPYWFTAQSSRAGENTAKNDRPRIGAVGLGSQGNGIARRAAEYGDVVAVCDADLQRAERAREAFGGKAEVYQDYRRLLDRNDLDVITNGTPDHWHTAVNIAACRSGRDVYAEKPLTLTIDEGKRLCQVVEETERIVQVGTQHRSNGFCQTAVELVRNGRLGKLHQVWVAVPYLSTKGGPFDTLPVPPQLDWDLYQGQAPEHDYCLERTHRNFRWWYEYSGGMATDWGNHYVDIAHWGMDCERTGPVSIEARGIFPNPPGPEYFNTADRFFSRMVYPGGVELLFFSSLNERMNFQGRAGHEPITPEQIEQLFGKDAPEEAKTLDRSGIMFLGENGRIFANPSGVYGTAAEELAENPLPDDAWRAYPSSNHMANFFECIATRKQPCAPVDIEHRTVTACHLANIAMRLGRKLAWDPEAEQIVGDDEANGWQVYEQRAPYTISG